MTGKTPIQKPIWEENLQTALDFVNSCLGDIDSVGGEKEAYEKARKDLEDLLQLILKICRDEWTAEYPINEWVFNYKRYVKGPSCDCLTVKEKDKHIMFVYLTTTKTNKLASLSKSSKRYKASVAQALSAMAADSMPDVRQIKKYNCCMDKITKGVHKEHQVLGAMANKRHANGLSRQAEKPMVSQSKSYQNGNHIAAAAGAQAGASSSGSAGAGIITDMISASLSGTLGAALGGNFNAGIFGNVSAQLGCESYSFQSGILSNINGSLGFNFGFSICSPKLGASANVLSTYSAGVFASTMAAIDGGIDLWTPSSTVNYTANSSTSVLDATLSPPFENFDRKKNCKCAAQNDAGMAGDLIPPNGNLDSHEKVVQRAEDQTRQVKKKIEDLKCNTYCCCKHSKKKKEPNKREESEFEAMQVMRIPASFPTLSDNLDKVIITSNESFFAPPENQGGAGGSGGVNGNGAILVVNGIQAKAQDNGSIENIVLPILNSRTKPFSGDISPTGKPNRPGGGGIKNDVTPSFGIPSTNFVGGITSSNNMGKPINSTLNNGLIGGKGVKLKIPEFQAGQGFTPEKAKKILGEDCFQNNEEVIYDIDLEQINTIVIKSTNEEKNNNTKCASEFFKSKTTCLPIPKVVEVNNDLLQDFSTEENSIVTNTSPFINSVQDLKDSYSQQYFFNSVNHTNDSPPIMYQIIDNNIVQIQE